MHFSRWRAHPRLLWLCAVGVMIALDQLDQGLLRRDDSLGSSIEVMSWFNLVHALNEGACFFASRMLVAGSAGFSLLLAFWLVAPHAHQSIQTRRSSWSG